MVASSSELALLNQSSPQSELDKLTGPRLRDMLRDASALLERHVAALNAINVFPVPDGDTGTNMHLTLRAAVKALDDVAAESLSDVAAALAHGALMGARGNSGVILSQILRGLARGLEGKSEADGPELASALTAGSDAAYAALAEPKEGTILTVVRAAAEAAQGSSLDVGTVLSRATDAAHQAVERTPDLLPVLKEAGVVDAGGLGLAIVLNGLSRSFRGDSLDVDLAPDIPDTAGWQSEAATLHQVEHGAAGYCTEFVVTGANLDAAAARTHLESLGTSLLVVGDETLLRVHVHTATPDDALNYGRGLGEVSQVKVDNMEEQMRRFASSKDAPPVVADIGIVAVTAGDGIQAAFRSVGVTHLVQGGQTMNPSAGDILEAIRACPQERIIVLPNNKNIIAAAEQAAGEADKTVSVIPTRSIPQGVAAVLALNPDLSFEQNAEAMQRASTTVRSAEVTRAVRATVIDGRQIDVGQAIGIVDGKLSVVSSGLDDAVIECVSQMMTPDAALLTIYFGADVREPEAAALTEALQHQHADLEVELVPGGQPHYAYVLSLE